jgi:hypothetical protein
MRSSSHELSHVRQAKRASIYNALAGSEFRIEGVKLIINDWKTSGSAGGENTSMLVYCNEGVFLAISQQTDQVVRCVTHKEGFFAFTVILVRLRDDSLPLVVTPPLRRNGKHLPDILANAISSALPRCSSL